jgi:TRAP-type uncharacterized transport system fused permease subunit
MYLIPLLFIYTPLVSGSPGSRFYVFTFTALGFIWYSIITSGYFRGILPRWVQLGGIILLPPLFLNYLYLQIAAAAVVITFIIIRFFKTKETGGSGRKISSQGVNGV